MITVAQELAAHLLLGLSRALDLRRSKVWRTGSEASREQLGELPRGSEVNVCRLCELVGESVTCRQNRHSLTLDCMSASAYAGHKQRN